MRAVESLWKGLLAILIGCGLSRTLSAQVVTSPFDPTQAVILPSAAGWRDMSAVGARYFESSGTRDFGTDNTYEYDSAGSSINVMFRVNSISIDGYVAQESNNVKVDQYYDGSINLARSDARFNLALSGNDFVTVGLGGRKIEREDYLDATHDSETATETRVGGSISVKMREVFFIGGGFERVTEESSFKVDNVWNEASGGVALRVGTPGETRFRLEFSYTHSPQEERDAQDDLLANMHLKTGTSRVSAELMFSGLLFSLNGVDTKKTLPEKILLNSKVVSEIQQRRTEVGVAWVPQNGLLLGFSFNNDEVNFGFQEETSAFQINLGYVF